MNRTLGAIVAAVLVAGAGPAMAQGWYAGLSLGNGGVNISAAEIGLSSGNLDDNDTTFGARIGYDFSKYIGVEAAYYDLGKYQFSGLLGPFTATGEMKAKSYNISLVGNVPFGDREQFGAYGKLGYARTRIQPTADIAIFQPTGSDWESEATYGAGFKWMVDRNWGLFGEWSRLHDTQIEQWLAGAMVRF